MIATILLVLAAVLLFLESIGIKTPYVSLGWFGLFLFVLVGLLGATGIGG